MRLDGMRVFLSGPMSGVDDLNRPAFAEAKRVCEAAGAEFVFDPTHAWGHSDRPREWYMLRDIHRLSGKPEYDNVLANYGYTKDQVAYTGCPRLDGWHLSNGAWRESTVADECGIPCYELDDVIGEVDG